MHTYRNMTIELHKLKKHFASLHIGQNIQEWTKQNLWTSPFEKFEDKAFKNGPSKICGRQLLKKFTI